MTKILEAEALARRAEPFTEYVLTTVQLGGLEAGARNPAALVAALYDVGASIVQSLDRHHEIARARGRSEYHISDAIRELIAMIEADDSGHTIAHHAEAIATHLREIDTTLGTK